MENQMEIGVQNNGVSENPTVSKFPAAAENPTIVVTEASVQMLTSLKATDALNASTPANNFIAQAKAEYAEAHGRIIEKIRLQHLEPFVKVLSERAKITPKFAAGVVESLKKDLVERLSTEAVTERPGVTDKMLTLEILKDKYRQYEGVNWNVQNKTPVQRTLPLEIQYKEKELKALRKQLALQIVELDKVLAENKARRVRIQDIMQERVFIQQNMVRHSERLKQMDAEIMRMQLELLDLMDKP